MWLVLNPPHWNYSFSIPLKFPINNFSMSFKQTGGQGRLLNNLEKHFHTTLGDQLSLIVFANTIHGKMMVIQSYKFANSTIYQGNFFQWGCLALCYATYSNT
jgi:hypothetical protein